MDYNRQTAPAFNAANPCFHHICIGETISYIVTFCPTCGMIFDSRFKPKENVLTEHKTATASLNINPKEKLK